MKPGDVVVYTMGREELTTEDIADFPRGIVVSRVIEDGDDQTYWWTAWPDDLSGSRRKPEVSAELEGDMRVVAYA